MYIADHEKWFRNLLTNLMTCVKPKISDLKPKFVPDLGKKNTTSSKKLRLEGTSGVIKSDVLLNSGLASKVQTS